MQENNSKSYKEVSINLGSSVFGAFVFVGNNEKDYVRTSAIQFIDKPEENVKAYLVRSGEGVEIPPHYTLDTVFYDFLRIYNDDSCVFYSYCPDSVFKVYKSEEDIIILEMLGDNEYFRLI